ncbi:MAG TPA: TIGR02996 domain-containing protein [Gemmataceae bacterium]|nr:TIGR02996 domain-containing protein [Gemmataceae bacterium]
MDHERAFLQAIREEPHDDAHRLIYADWLEEQGGAHRTARANFIRAQCRFAVLPADDPMRGALEGEAADLLAEHECAWTQPLHGLAEDWQFARGFVEAITIKGADFLTHAERLFAFAPLRAVHLLIGPKDIPHLAACPFLQFVETLDFRRCHLNDRSLQQLLTSPYLQRLSALDLDGNGITTPGIQSLVHSSVFMHLRRLNLSRNAGVGDKAIHLLARSPHAESLEELGLAATNATLEGLQNLFQSPHLPRLTSLNVARTRSWWAQLTSPLRIWADSKLLRQLRNLDLSENVHPASVGVLLDSLRAPHLHTLHLRSIAAGSSEAKFLANSPHLANLTFLDLRKNNLGAEGMQILADSPHLASLTHLDVSSNNIRDTGAKALAASPHFRRLAVLDLARNGIGGPGLQALAESPNLQHVTMLNLAANFIGADSVRALAESGHLSRLSWLDLSDACLDETSARVLASSANLARLATLLLQKNQLGDAGAKALAQSPHLQRLATLDLNDNRIGKAGAEALAVAPSWRRMRKLDLRGNVFTDTQEALLRERFADAVLL